MEEFKTLSFRLLDLLGISIDPKKVRFLKLEFPEYFKKDPDLVFEYRGKIYHIEIQSEDNPKATLRMLYYHTLILGNYEKCPRQFMFYIGKKPSKRIKPFLKNPNLEYYYTLIDVNRIDCSEILGSSSQDYWILAILCQLGKDAKGVKEILKSLSLIENPQERRKQFKSILQMASIESKNLKLLTKFEKGFFARRDWNLKTRNRQ